MGIAKETVGFYLDGDLIVGDLYLPEGSDPSPGVVVGGPMASVKEQVTGVYSRALAERGIASLCLDHRHYGESAGIPRQYEHYPSKILDLCEAIEELSRHPAIDSERLGIAGVCLGVGYASWAAVKSPRVKAIGGVVGYYRDVPKMRAADPSGFEQKIEQGIAARRLYEETGEVEIVPAAALEGDAAMTLESTYDYYATPRAGVANYVNAFAVMSREYFIPFDVQSAAPKINLPFMMVHSENALSPPFARSFYDALQGKKEIRWVDGENQTAFYDEPNLVSKSADYLAEHFLLHL